jgi:hypothetical protein
MALPQPRQQQPPPPAAGFQVFCADHHGRPRDRSHSHKREELNSNSSMPSKEKIELLFSKYLVRCVAIARSLEHVCACACA